MKDKRILTDGMLGKLTRILRMVGHDVVYGPDENLDSDEEIERYAKENNRIILTRDKEIDGVLIESVDVDNQLQEIKDLGIDLCLDNPKRCSVCNSKLKITQDKPNIAPDFINKIWKCRNCGKYYWKGTHWEDVKERIKNLD